MVGLPRNSSTPRRPATDRRLTVGHLRRAAIGRPRRLDRGLTPGVARGDDLERIRVARPELAAVPRGPIISLDPAPEPLGRVRKPPRRQPPLVLAKMSRHHAAILHVHE